MSDDIAGRYRVTDEDGSPLGDWRPIKIESVNLATGVVTIDPPAEVEQGQRFELVLDYVFVIEQPETFGTIEVIE